MGFLSKVIGVAAPIVGAAFGGPAGAAIGGAISGAARGGDVGDILRGAGLSYVGASLPGWVSGAGELANTASGIADTFWNAPAAEMGFGSLNPYALEAFADIGPAGELVRAAGGFSGGAPVVELSRPFTAPNAGTFSQELLGLIRAAAGRDGEGAGPLSSALNIGSGVYGLYNAYNQRKRIEELMRMADPAAGVRAQAAGQLSRLMTDPSLIASDPGYQAAMRAALHKGAALGQLGGGNMVKLMGQAGLDFYGNAFSRLAGLAGGDPSAAARLNLAANAGADDMISRGLASIAYGVRRI